MPKANQPYPITPLDNLTSFLSEKEIEVISPYNDQVDLLRSQRDHEELEIKSVDGFQGREKEVIVISFVRSNEEDEVGFLNDFRRLNVALTRARRKLIMIGDSNTLSKIETFSNLVTFVKERGLLISPGNYK